MFELTDEQARALAEAEFDYKMPPKPKKKPRREAFEQPTQERKVYFQRPAKDGLMRYSPRRYRFRIYEAARADP